MKMREKIRKLRIGISCLLLFIILFQLTFFVLANQNITEESEIKIHFFEQRGCPDCAKQKDFLEGYIKNKYPEIEIITYSIMSPENQEKFHEMMNERGVEDYRLMVPVIFIGDNYFQGFYEKDKELIKRAIEGENVQEEILKIRKEHIIKIPFYGEINVSDWSIPLLALIIGSLDGLNVCSIGALILILTLVLGSFQSRKKIVFYGGLFILTSAIIYGILVFVWTTLFDTLSTYIGGINIIIGIGAFLGGAFFFKKFLDFYKYGPACEYSGNKYIIKATKKLKDAFSSQEKTFFLMISVIIFAGIITLVELPCSFGLPMVYGGVLVSEGVSAIGYLFYIGLYLFFYMFIELVIFAGAVVTKEIWFAESKYITWIYLFGAIVLLLLSYYYLIGF